MHGRKKKALERLLVKNDDLVDHFGLGLVNDSDHKKHHPFARPCARVVNPILYGVCVMWTIYKTDIL